MGGKMSSKRGERHTKYHIQRVITRAVERAQDNLVLARDSLELLLSKHPEGLEDGWEKHDLVQLEIRLNDALKSTGDFFYWQTTP